MKDSFAFWDSSALVPLCCQRVDSDALRQVLRQKPRIVAWWSAMIEAHSALARLLREGTLTPKGYADAVRRLNVCKPPGGKSFPATNCAILPYRSRKPTNCGQWTHSNLPLPWSGAGKNPKAAALSVLMCD